jgi:hypothetical protein
LGPAPLPSSLFHFPTSSFPPALGPTSTSRSRTHIMNDRDFRRLARTKSEESLLRVTSVEDIDELFNQHSKGPKWMLMKLPASAQTSEPKPYQVSWSTNPPSEYQLLDSVMPFHWSILKKERHILSPSEEAKNNARYIWKCLRRYDPYTAYLWYYYDRGFRRFWSRMKSLHWWSLWDLLACICSGLHINVTSLPW